MERLRRWVREPLLHFIMVGLLAFGVDRWMSPPAPAPASEDVIEVGPAVRGGLRDEWRRQMGRIPGAEEEETLVEDWIDREVLYRRALDLGLDRADPVLRKRLVDQMRLIIEGEVSPRAPTEEELAACLAETPEQYRRPAAVSFEHFFLSTALRGARVRGDADALLAQLRAGTDAAVLRGDPFVRGSRFRDHDRTALTRVFGPVFAAAVLEAPEGIWSGPLQSVHGLHLVRVSAHREERAAGVAEVRRRLEKDCANRRQAAALRAALDALRGRYTIVRTDAN